MAEALTAELYSADGALQGTVDLNPEVFGIEPNRDVMHQVVTAQLAAARAGTASTKTRSEVRGGGRKPWRQKGLGRARHGSIRSPQWAGGGVAHGPKPRDYSQRTPKKMRRLALRGALSARAAAGRIKVVETFDTWETPSTKQAVALLDAMGVEGKVLLLAEDHEHSAIKSFRNLPSVIASNLGQANTYDVLWATTLVMSRGTLDLGQSAPRGTEEHAAGAGAPKVAATDADASDAEPAAPQAVGDETPPETAGPAEAGLESEGGSAAEAESESEVGSVAEEGDGA